MTRLLLLAAAMAIPATAHAGHVANCFSQAQDDYPTAAITVTVNSAAVVSGGTVAATFDALASTDSTDTVSVATNSAADDAIAQAQSCVLAGGRLTWSMARMYEVAQAQRAHSVLFRLELGGTTYNLDSARKVVDSGTGQMMVQFFETGAQTCTTVSYDAYALGGDDYYVTGLSVSGAKKKDTCSGVKCRACKFDSGTCHCTNPVTEDPEESYCNHTTSTEEETEFAGSDFYMGS